jgi:hypothetical protein
MRLVAPLAAVVCASRPALHNKRQRRIDPANPPD